jgi:uncharacterized phage protein (TIGR02218 family)
MRAASPAFIQLLNTASEFYLADLYSFTLANGQLLRYSGADISVTVNGNLYVAGGLEFVRGQTRTMVGLEVDTLEVTLFADATTTVNGMPALAFARTGGFDGATFVLERMIAASPADTSAGTVVMFSGRIADVEVGRTTAKLSVKSLLELLNLQLPRNLYQPGCVHTLFDSGCRLLKANFAVSGQVLAGSTAALLNTNLGQATGTFDLGTISFSSGANAGRAATVKAQVGGTLSFANPLPAAPAIGDTFTAYPGCDKSQATCTAKFANLANFRGFPYVPMPETAR